MRREVIQKGIIDPNKRNIALFIGKLAGGGAERMASRLSAALADRYNVITIIYSPKAVHYHRYGTVINAGGKSHLLKLRVLHAALNLNRIIREYKIETVISFLDAPNIVNGLCNHSARKILSIRTWQEKTMATTIRDRILYLLLQKAFKKSDRLITLTERQKRTTIRETGLSEERVTVLENFYNTEVIREKAGYPVGDQEIRDFLGPQTTIAAGRLADKKNTARLLYVFREVLISVPEARLLLIGDGPLKMKLKRQCAELGLNGAVMFAGRIDDPYPVIGKAAAYISLSENEGFPNALVEAMICSVPVLHTDCPTGPREILNSTEEQSVDHVVWAPYGVLLPVEGSGDKELRRRKDIARAWARVLTEDDLRNTYAKAGRERAKAYDVSKGKEAYSRLIDEVLESSSC